MVEVRGSSPLRSTKNFMDIKQVIQDSKKILILGHNKPDLDSISSSLLVKEILEKHFGNKLIDICVREINWPILENLQLPGYSAIKNLNETDIINFDNYDLIFLVDISDYTDRLPDIPTNIEKTLQKTIVIDHHKTEIKLQPLLNVNDVLCSATLQIYNFFKNLLKESFVTTPNISQLTQMGIVGDTGRFLFTNLITAEVYSAMADLTKVYKLDNEKIDYELSKSSPQSLLVFSHLISNIRYRKDYAYSYVDPKFISEYSIELDGLINGYEKFKFIILRYIDNYNWGYVLKPSLKANVWDVSFRSMNDGRAVNKIAESFNGGGHMYAAAAKILASSYEDVIKIINNRIDTLTV